MLGLRVPTRDFIRKVFVMRAIVFRPSIRRASVICSPFLLSLPVGGALLLMLGGCSQGRFFSPLAGHRALDDSAPSMHGPALSGPGSIRTQTTHQQTTHQAMSQNSPGRVRVTSEDAIPETDIEPVPQRLTPTRSGGGPSVAQQVSHRANPDVTAEQLRDALQPQAPAQTDPAAAEILPASHVVSFSDSGPSATLELPEGYDGVDVNGLMSALQDSPPEVQKAAIARLIAMSRMRARSTSQPQSIDEALAAAFDSLPELPDEVIDRGLSPSRIGKSQPAATAAISTANHAVDAGGEPDNPQPIATSWASKTVSSVSAATPAAPVAAVSPKSDAADNLSIASIQVPIASTGGDTRSAARPSVGMPDAEESGVGEPSEPPTEIASQPSKAVTPEMSDAQLYDALVARLQTQPESETDAERHRRQVVARHLMVLAGKPDRAVDNLEGLSHQEQEYLRHQLRGLWTIIDPNGHPVPSRRFSSALPEIRKATSFLAAASDSLEVRGVEFCTEIEAYGQIKPFPSRRFASGQEVILYCEIDNFVSQSVSGGFETRLQGSYDLLDSEGNRVSSQTLPEDQQVSKNRLRDYFIAYQMYLPDSIEPGEYQLRLTMEDVHGKKYGQSNIKFEIKR